MGVTPGRVTPNAEYLLLAAAAIGAPEHEQIDWFCPRMIASKAEALIETQVPFRCDSFSGGRRWI